MWLRSFGPWISTSIYHTSAGAKPKKVSLSASISAGADFMSKGLASIGLSSSVQVDQAAERAIPAGGRAPEVAASPPEALNKKKGASKLFSSATKGVLNAFGVRVTSADSPPAPASSSLQPAKQSSQPSTLSSRAPLAPPAPANLDTPLLDEAIRQQRSSTLPVSDSMFPKSLQDLIQELGNLSTPLQDTHRKIVEIKAQVGRATVASTGMITNAQESIGKAAIGLAAVKVLYEEVIFYIFYM
jgi:hypothetical protein